MVILDTQRRKEMHPQLHGGLNAVLYCVGTRVSVLFCVDEDSGLCAPLCGDSVSPSFTVLGL